MRARVPLTLGTMAVLVLATAVAVWSPVRTARAAGGLDGAIFTTLSDGSEVNFNIYAAKTDVYLNGGPGINAPAGAAGLPDGTYVFQVTDPSGKTLLSQDPAGCREFTVGPTTALPNATSGVISSYAPSVSPCTPPGHATGIGQGGVAVGGVTIQLMPFADTPNNGGEYKVWATLVGNFTCALTDVDCPNDTHGFVPSDSKTDNFKVKVQGPEIDARFHGDVSGDLLDGRDITHTDTLGGTDVKWSYLNTAINVNHEAHVEAPEIGTHLITINNQPGCSVDDVTVTNSQTGKSYSTGVLGPQSVSVNISPSLKAGSTIFVDVWCLGI